MKDERFLGALLTLTLAGCFNPTSKNKSGSSEAPKGKTGEFDIPGSDQPLAELKLCDSLLPRIPGHLKGKGPSTEPGISKSTSTSSRKKSREACIIRQKVRETVMNQERAAMDICYTESQKGIKAGGKYKMTFPAFGMRLTQLPPSEDMTQPEGSGVPADPQEISVFLDNSDTDNFKFYSCTNGKLVQKIVLSGAGEQGSRGSYKAEINDAFYTFATVGSFDNRVGESDRQKLASQMSLTMDKFSFSSNMLLDLSATGVSTVKIADEISSSEGDINTLNREIGVALIDQNFGSVLIQRAFQGTDSFFPNKTPGPGADLQKTQIETSRAFFDAAGQTLDQTDSDRFKEGGALFAKEDMFPKLLPNDFKVQFEPGDWDCSGTVDIEVDEGALKQVEEKFSYNLDQEQCEDSFYDVGKEEDFPPVIDQRDEFGPPDFEDLPPSQSE